MDEGEGLALSLKELGRRKRQKDDPLSALFGLAGFIITMGMLIGATGLICYIPFHNIFSRAMLTVGFIFALSGLVIKIMEVFLKLIGVRK
jgi:hypothetical protein